MGFLSLGTAQPQVSGRKENNSSIRSWISYSKRLALLRAPALCIPLRRRPFPCSSRLLPHAEEWESAPSLCQKRVSAQLPNDSLPTQCSSRKWGLTFGLQYVMCFCFSWFWLLFFFVGGGFFVLFLRHLILQPSHAHHFHLNPIPSDENDCSRSSGLPLETFRAAALAAVSVSIECWGIYVTL